MLNTQHLGRLWLLCACLALGSLACADPDSPDTEESTDHVKVGLARAADYQSGGFVLLNELPIPSLAVAGAAVRVWVSDEALDAYRSVKQDTTLSLPVGAVIVREVFRTGTLEKITVVARGPSGSAPEVGDLWFAVLDPQGNILPDKAGVPQLGNVADCVACHKTRAAHSFLFGF